MRVHVASALGRGANQLCLAPTREVWGMGRAARFLDAEEQVSVDARMPVMDAIVRTYHAGDPDVVEYEMRGPPGMCTRGSVQHARACDAIITAWQGHLDR